MLTSAESFNSSAETIPLPLHKPVTPSLRTTEELSAFPFIGRVVPEFKIETVREIIYRPYRIVYRVREEQKIVEILRVWHAAEERREFLSNPF